MVRWLFIRGKNAPTEHTTLPPTTIGQILFSIFEDNKKPPPMKIAFFFSLSLSIMIKRWKNRMQTYNFQPFIAMIIFKIEYLMVCVPIYIAKHLSIFFSIINIVAIIIINITIIDIGCCFHLCVYTFVQVFIEFVPGIEKKWLRKGKILIFLILNKIEN